MCVQLESFGVESWQLEAVCPNLSSGVYWSVNNRKLESGSSEIKQAERIDGTSLCQQHISRSCLDAAFSSFFPRSILHPMKI